MFPIENRLLDRDELRHKRVLIASSFAPKHINIKALFALWYSLPKEVGMSTALQIAGLPFEGTHHRDDDDAWNIAVLFAGIMKHAWKNLKLR